MVYAIEDIARTLKEAREVKGLSQRALSAKVGLTQAHISNIENAAADLHLSNLMELARALDLEVMLVPRKAVPAAQGLIRNIETATWLPSDPSKTLRFLERSFEKLAAINPDAADIPKLRNLVAAFRNFRLNKDQVHVVDSAARELQRITDSLQKTKVPNLHAAPTEMQRLNQITNRLREMRNAIVHAVPSSNLSRVQPAYRLDDGEPDG
jgi:transcriptional regulator with XRE-family HTH domain